MRAQPRAALTFAAFALAATAYCEEPGISLRGSTTAAFSAWEDRGSALVPKGSAAPYSGAAGAELRAEAGELSRCAFEGAASIDAASGAVSGSIRELWAELRPISAISIRAGRQRFGFGSGYGWNPSNDLDPPRNAADPTAPRSGADAARLRLDASDALGWPLTLSVAGMLPDASSSVKLEDSKLGAQAYALLGPLELMATASASGFGGELDSYLAGGWATVGVGPLVLGLEAAARSRSDRYRPDSSGLPVADRELLGAATVTATLRSGDFVVVAEANWDQAALSRDELELILDSPAIARWAKPLAQAGSVGAWHSLARAEWASDDWGAAAGAVVDLETGSFIATAELSASVQGRADAKIAASLPGSIELLEDDELGLSGRGASIGASITLHF
jgi:hypothetical protein